MVCPVLLFQHLCSVRSRNEPELLQRRHAIIEPDFLLDLAVRDAQHSRAGEAHLPAGRGRQRSDEKVTEGRTGVCAAAFPAANDVVALCDEVSRAPEVEARAVVTPGLPGMSDRDQPRRVRAIAKEVLDACSRSLVNNRSRCDRTSCSVANAADTAALSADASANASSNSR